MAAPTDKREAALAWAARGFKVFPLRPGSKLPIDKSWYDLASNDADTVRRIWTDPVLGWPKTYNVGVLTDDLIVVDIDTKSGKPGLDTYLNLGLPLDTLLVRTPSGGMHAYFTGPPRASTVEQLGPGVDTRGHHGFVIAPGSELDGGRFYSLEVDAPVRPLPTAIVDRLPLPKSTPASREALVELDASDAVARAVDFARTAPPAVMGQGADAHTYAIAAAVKDLGVSEEMALTLLAEHYLPRCAAPRSLDEQLAFLKRKVSNAYNYGRSPPGVADPALHYGGLGQQLLAPERPKAPTAGWYYHGDPWDINVNWLFEETLPMVGTALLVGPSGSGKTYVAMHLAGRLARGETFFGVPCEAPGAVLYLTSESLHSAKVRLAGIADGERLPIALRFVNGLSDKEALKALLEDIRDEGMRQARSFGLLPRMLVLDTLSASGLLLDEDDNAEAAAAMAMLERVAMDLNLLVLVLHHPPKHGGGSRGAGALHNSADYVMEIKREGNAAVRTLALAKSRDGPEKELGAFTLPAKTVGQDSRGKPLISCTVSMADAPAPRDAAPEAKYTEILVRAVEFSLVEHGEDIEGRRAVDLDVVKETFSEMKPGNRGPRAVASAFKGALQLASETGVVESYVWQGRTYMNLRSQLQ